jgi:hypothetical protein
MRTLVIGDPRWFVNTLKLWREPTLLKNDPDFFLEIMLMVGFTLQVLDLAIDFENQTELCVHTRES